MKPICLIAARRGSKGVPIKNIKMIGGKPLIAHTIKSSLDSKIFSHVIVSTEDDEIAKIAKKYGAEVPFLRPKKLATKNAPMAKVIDHAINKLFSLGYNFDVLVNRDCTAPFIRISDIKKGISLLGRKKSDLVVAAYKTHLNPYFNMMEFDSNEILGAILATTHNIAFYKALAEGAREAILKDEYGKYKKDFLTKYNSKK